MNRFIVRNTIPITLVITLVSMVFGAVFGFFTLGERMMAHADQKYCTKIELQSVCGDIQDLKLSIGITNNKLDTLQQNGCLMLPRILLWST